MVHQTGHPLPAISTILPHHEQAVRQDEGIDTVHIFTVADVDLHPVVLQQLALLLVCLALLAQEAAHWQGAPGAREQGGAHGDQAGGADR